MSTLKTYSLDEITDKHIGKKGTVKREIFENELRLDLLGEAIKQARKERHLTQEELGKLVGVKKAQISKIENKEAELFACSPAEVKQILNSSEKANVPPELIPEEVKLML